MEFENGKAVIKSGKKVVAKVYDRNVFFRGTKWEGRFSKRYSLEISGGIRECDTIDEVEFFMKIYAK